MITAEQLESTPRPSDVRYALGVVLAGAYSWNNSAFDRQVPRPLMPVAGRPLISYALGWLREGGVARAVVCTNRETRSLQGRLAEHMPADFRELDYREDPMPRGPAGCVRDAAADSDADTFIVTDGTAIPNVDLGDLLHRHRDSGAALTVVVHHEAARRGGAGRQVPCGTYIIDRRALALVKSVGYVDIKENLIPILYGSGERVLTYSVDQPGPRVLNLATYLSANEWMLHRLAKGASDLKARGAFVAADAVLIGPVLLGRGVCVMSGATIVGPTSIGEGSVVKSGALVSRSAVWKDCVIGEKATTDRCLLADGAVVAPWSRQAGTVRSGDERRPRNILAPRDSLGFGELLRRRFTAKPAQNRVASSGTRAAAS